MSNTYRAAIYKAFNEVSQNYDEYFFQTYTDDAIESNNRKFITGEQLGFLSALMGEGGGDFEDTAYGDLVNQVAELETFKETLEGMLEDGPGDTENIIDKLTEILDFITNAAIDEDTTLEEFISQFNQWTINGHSPEDEKQFYAFEEKGTTGQVAVSNGTRPVWTDNLTVGQGGTGKTSLGNNAILIGKGTSSIDEISPGPADSVLAGNGASSAPSFKQEITIKKITASDEISTPSLDVTESATIKQLTVPGTGAAGTGLFEGAYEVTQMKNAVAKETTPVEGDFDRNFMVDGLIWIDTSSNISIPESKTYNLSLQCPDSQAAADEFINWLEIDIIDEFLPLNTSFAEPGDPSITNLQLLDIESSDNIHYQLYAYQMNVPTMGPMLYLSLVKGHLGDTEVLWSISFDKQLETLEFLYGPLDIIIPNGKVIINNLHLGPRIFKLKTVWSVT